MAFGADFGCMRCCKTNPVDLEGSRGQVLVVFGGFGRFYRGRGLDSQLWPKRGRCVLQRVIIGKVLVVRPFTSSDKSSTSFGIGHPHSATRPLSKSLQKLWVFWFFDPGQGEVRGPPGGPPGPSVGLPGASRRPPGPKTNQSKKPRNPKELTEHWRRCNMAAPVHPGSPGRPRGLGVTPTSD